MRKEDQWVVKFVPAKPTRVKELFCGELNGDLVVLDNAQGFKSRAEALIFTADFLYQTKIDRRKNFRQTKR